MLLDLHTSFSGAGKFVWNSHLFKNFPQFVWSTQSRLQHSQWSRSKCLSGTLLFFHDPTDVHNLISGSSAFSKSSLYVWKFSFHILLKPSLKDFEHYFASTWNECNCVVVWTFFTSLACFIPRYFILFDEIIKRIVSLISLLDGLLIVFRSETFLYINFVF